MSLETRLKAAFERVAATIKLRGLPAGGAAGQVLTKTGGADYAAGWVTPAAGGGSGGGSVVLPETIYRPWSQGYTWTLGSGVTPYPNTDSGWEMWDGVIPSNYNYSAPEWAGWGTDGSAPTSITHTIQAADGEQLRPQSARAYVLHTPGVGIYQPQSLRLECLVDGVWELAGTAALSDPVGERAGWLTVIATQQWQSAAMRLVLAHTQTSRQFIFAGELEMTARVIVPVQ